MLRTFPEVSEGTFEGNVSDGSQISKIPSVIKTTPIIIKPKKQNSFIKSMTQ
jgi:hypothetical protein